MPSAKFNEVVKPKGLFLAKVMPDDVAPDYQFGQHVFQRVVFELRERPPDELWPMLSGQTCFSRQKVNN